MIGTYYCGAMTVALTDRKVFRELRECGEMFLCIGKAIMLGIERRFPGMCGLLKLKALTKYGSLPDDIMISDPILFVKLLEELFSNRELLETTLEDILAKLTKKHRELVKVLLSKNEVELYVKLINSYNSVLLKRCRKMLH